MRALVTSLIVFASVQYGHIVVMVRNPGSLEDVGAFFVWSTLVAWFLSKMTWEVGNRT